jgi:uncharacterized membrane protein
MNDEKKNTMNDKKETTINDQKEKTMSDEKETIINDQKEKTMSDEKETIINDQKEKTMSDEREATMSNKKEKCYKDRSVWLRGLFMLLFVFLLSVAKFVTLAVIVLQFLHVLFTGKMNSNLLLFGKSLSVYQYQVMLFLTYNSETQPFPMDDWPTNDSENI